MQEDGTRILKLGMVYGANASGKSNLVEAFSFLRRFIHKTQDDRNAETGFIPFMFGDTANQPGKFELTIYVEGKKYRYTLLIDNEKVLDEKLLFYPGTQPAVVFHRQFDDTNNVSQIEFGSKIKISEQAWEAIQLKALKNTSVFAAYNKVNVSIPELERVKTWLGEQYLDSIDPYTDLTSFSDKGVKNHSEIKEHTLEFLKEADFNIEDIQFEERVHKVPEDVLNMIDKAPLPEDEIARIKKEKVYRFEETLFRHKIEEDEKVVYYSLPEERQSRGTFGWGM